MPGSGIGVEATGPDRRPNLNVSKGNIVDQLRYRVRAEAAKTMRDSLPCSSSVSAAVYAGATRGVIAGSGNSSSGCSVKSNTSRTASVEGETNSSTSGITNPEYSKSEGSEDSEKGSGDDIATDAHSAPVPSFAKSFGEWKTAEQLEREIDEEEMQSLPPTTETTRYDDHINAKFTKVYPLKRFF